jgi:hypothetical protein
MIWTAILRDTVRTAFQITEEYPVSRPDLLILQSAFPEYTLHELNLARPYFGEYLGMKRALSFSAEELVEASYAPGILDPPVLLQYVPGWLLNAFYKLTFQKNRTHSVLNRFWSAIIDEAGDGLERAAPPDTISEDGHYSRLPPLRNLSGWYFFRLPSFFAFEKHCVKLSVANDLFTYALGPKLGSNPVVEDFYSHKPNVVRGDGRKLRAPGRDGVFGSEDDIVLETFY